jgi:endonuclease/exonuclease/phosphatase family metal-dependent hydrolase
LGAAFIGVGFYKNAAVPENALRIMTYNVGDTRSPAAENYIEALAGIIKEEAPDIVLLQEAYRPKAEKLAGLTGYRTLFLPEETQQHVWLLSRQPFRFVEAKKLSAHDGVGKNVVCAEVETDKGPLLACSVYFTSIRSEIAKDQIHDKAELASMSLKEVFLENSRSREAKELVDWLASLQYEYMLIGGDFNSLFLSKTARTMRDLFKDSAWISPSLFSSSHNIVGLAKSARTTPASHVSSWNLSGGCSVF